jgi:hypothetical protein
MARYGEHSFELFGIYAGCDQLLSHLQLLRSVVRAGHELLTSLLHAGHNHLRVGIVRLGRSYRW